MASSVSGNPQQLTLDLNIVHRPSLKQKKRAEGQEGQVGFSNQAGYSQDKAGTKFRTGEDDQGRVVVELEGRTLWGSRNGMKVEESADSLDVELPIGYHITQKEGLPAVVEGPGGQKFVGKAHYTKEGERTVIGLSFKDGQGRDVVVDLKDLSFRVEDSKQNLIQHFSPEGHQYLEVRHNYRDHDGKYSVDVQKALITAEGQVLDLSADDPGSSDFKMNSQELSFRNRGGAKMTYKLPVIYGGPLSGENVKPEPQAPAPPPVAEQLTPQQREEQLGVIRPEDPSLKQFEAPRPEVRPTPPTPPPIKQAPAANLGQPMMTPDPMTARPNFDQVWSMAMGLHGDPNSTSVMTPSGLNRTSSPDGETQMIQLPNQMNLMVVGDQGFALSMQPGTDPLPVQVSTRPSRRFPGMTEKKYEFQDHQGNNYTVFSKSADFMVESPDRSVGQLVLPNGEIRTAARGADGNTYFALTYPDGLTQATPPARCEPFLTDKLYLPNGQVSALPYGVPKDYQQMTQSFPFPGNFPISGETPVTFPRWNPEQGRQYHSTMNQPGRTQQPVEPNGWEKFKSWIKKPFGSGEQPRSMPVERSSYGSSQKGAFTPPEPPATPPTSTYVNQAQGDQKAQLQKLIDDTLSRFDLATLSAQAPGEDQLATFSADQLGALLEKSQANESRGWNRMLAGMKAATGTDDQNAWPGKEQVDAKVGNFVAGLPEADRGSEEVQSLTNQIAWRAQADTWTDWAREQLQATEVKPENGDKIKAYLAVYAGGNEYRAARQAGYDARVAQDRLQAEQSPAPAQEAAVPVQGPAAEAIQEHQVNAFLQSLPSGVRDSVVAFDEAFGQIPADAQQSIQGGVTGLNPSLSAWTQSNGVQLTPDMVPSLNLVATASLAADWAQTNGNQPLAERAQAMLEAYNTEQYADPKLNPVHIIEQARKTSVTP